MCRTKNGELLTNKNQVLARWKKNFEKNLNESSESEQPTHDRTISDVEQSVAIGDKYFEVVKEFMY
jgi:hypothetical protein